MLPIISRDEAVHLINKELSGPTEYTVECIPTCLVVRKSMGDVLAVAKD